MPETITLTDASFKSALRSQYGEFFYMAVQHGKKASVYAYVQSAAIGCVTDATIELEQRPTGIRIIFYTPTGIVEFCAEDVKYITHVKTGGITEWEIKTKQGISFEIIPG